jgi:hypothetical protein
MGWHSGMTLEKKVNLAQRHVDRGREIVQRQRVIAAGLGTEFSANLLHQFERTQKVFETDLIDLLSRRQ